jgi:hypothetical protein
VPQSCTTNGFLVEPGDEAGGEPVRVDEIGVMRCPPRRPRERDEHRGHEQREPGRRRRFPTTPWPYAIPKWWKESGETARPSRLGPQPIDGVGDEATDHVLRRARYDVVRTTTFTRQPG